MTRADNSAPTYDELAAALRTFVDLSRDTFDALPRKPYTSFRAYLVWRSKNAAPAAQREADALLTAMDLLGITE